MGALLRFYGDYTDKWGELQTIPVLAETVEEAEQRLRMDAGNFAKNLTLDPVWDLIVFDDGSCMTRGQWGMRVAAE